VRGIDEGLKREEGDGYFTGRMDRGVKPLREGVKLHSAGSEEGSIGSMETSFRFFERGMELFRRPRSNVPKGNSRLLRPKATKKERARRRD